MSWVRVDDRVADHPKHIAAGPVASWLWLCGLAYCNAQKKRDGFIPGAKVPTLFPMRSPMKHAQRLVAVGLWETAEGGFRIHDYHDYQLTAEQAEQLSQKRAEAGRLGGLRSGEQRRSKLLGSAKQSAEQNASKRLGTGTGSSPDPDPTRAREEDVGQAVDASGWPSLVVDCDGIRIGAHGRLELGVFDRAVPFPWPADWKLTADQLRVARAHGCTNPPLGWAKFRCHYAGLAHDRERGWHRRWDLKAQSWFLDHARMGCPCQRRPTPEEKAAAADERRRHDAARAGRRPPGGAVPLAALLGAVPLEVRDEPDEEQRRAHLREQKRQLGVG